MVEIKGGGWGDLLNEFWHWNQWDPRVSLSLSGGVHLIDPKAMELNLVERLDRDFYCLGNLNMIILQQI